MIYYQLCLYIHTAKLVFPSANIPYSGNADIKKDNIPCCSMVIKTCKYSHKVSVTKSILNKLQTCTQYASKNNIGNVAV